MPEFPGRGPVKLVANDGEPEMAKPIEVAEHATWNDGSARVLELIQSNCCSGVKDNVVLSLVQARRLRDLLNEWYPPES